MFETVESSRNTSRRSLRSESPASSRRGRAKCSDLPSSGDLKKWLRAAPGVEGEAGGLFSGKMEWGAIVNRQGEICVDGGCDR